jgi:hypothetical protein
VQEHVLGLDVPVHQPVPVGVLQGGRHVAQDHDRLGERHRPGDEPCAQALAAHEGHRVVRQPLGRDARAEHGHDVRLLQRGGHPDLAREALGRESLGQLGGEHLHDDPAAERRILGEEHARHAPAAELALERVGGAERRLQAVAEQVGHGRRGQQISAAGVRRRYGRTRLPP